MLIADIKDLFWLNESRSWIGSRIEAGRVPHALLVHGPRGTGRRLLALNMLGRLLEADFGGHDWPAIDTVLIDDETGPAHPDFRLVQPLPEKRTITIAQVRELIDFLNLTSHQQGFKTVLINPADALTREAANGLLKTLEEPPGQSMLVLVTDSPSHLPATIASRCQRLRVATPARTEALAWLAGHEPGADWARILELADGAPLRALAWQRDGVARQLDEYSADLAALRRRQASPVAVAHRWHKSNPAVYLDYLYHAVSSEIREAVTGPGQKALNGRLQNDAENLNIERRFAVLRQIGDQRRRHGSGLNDELQLAAILANCCAGP